MSEKKEVDPRDKDTQDFGPELPAKDEVVGMDLGLAVMAALSLIRQIIDRVYEQKVTDAFSEKSTIEEELKKAKSFLSGVEHEVDEGKKGLADIESARQKVQAIQGRLVEAIREHDELEVPVLELKALVGLWEDSLKSGEVSMELRHDFLEAMNSFGHGSQAKEILDSCIIAEADSPPEVPEEETDPERSAFEGDAVFLDDEPAESEGQDKELSTDEVDLDSKLACQNATLLRALKTMNEAKNKLQTQLAMMEQEALLNQRTVFERMLGVSPWLWGGVAMISVVLFGVIFLWLFK